MMKDKKKQEENERKKWTRKKRRKETNDASNCTHTHKKRKEKTQSNKFNHIPNLRLNALKILQIIPL